MIEIKNFSKIYNNEKKAVDNISIKVNDGEIFAFIGHNGAGKTTTLKSIAGILDFEQGDILINGKSIKKEPIACKMQMAYVPDNPDLYENMKAIDFINFICDMYEVSKNERKEKIMPTFTALIGILMNLKYPKMDATSDTEVVKQSMSATLSVFIGMFVGMVSIGAMIMGSKINLNLFIILELLVFSAIAFVLWRILKKYGTQRFREINV